METKIDVDRGFIRRTDNKVIGKMMIKAPLAHYGSGFLSSANVTGFWGFDEDGRLIDVWVWNVEEGL